jgi:hypothetical protein
MGRRSRSHASYSHFVPRGDLVEMWVLRYDPQGECLISISQIFPIRLGLKAVSTPFEQQVYKVHGSALVAVGESVPARNGFKKSRGLLLDCAVVAGVGRPMAARMPGSCLIPGSPPKEIAKSCASRASTSVTR